MKVVVISTVMDVHIATELVLPNSAAVIARVVFLSVKPAYYRPMLLYLYIESRYVLCSWRIDG